jgi:hypothetical protein
LKERNSGRILGLDPGATKTARSFAGSFQINKNPPIEYWLSRRSHPSTSHINTIRSETYTRVANPAQSARLASGLTAALLCTPTIQETFAEPGSGFVMSEMKAHSTRQTMEWNLGWQMFEETEASKWQNN